VIFMVVKMVQYLFCDLNISRHDNGGSPRALAFKRSEEGQAIVAFDQKWHAGRRCSARRLDGDTWAQRQLVGHV
jgi:hypothetical protein